MAGDRSTLPRTGDELRDWLVHLFPGFRAAVGDTQSHPPGPTLTPHRVCSDFTDYYSGSIEAYDTGEVLELFRVIEVIAAADPHDADPVANALLTCFLENISCTDHGHASRVHMGTRSLRFFDGWHSPYLERLGLPRPS